ncbi:MAG: tetratricopeptide repeat protein [Bacteroidia bacterium]
MKTEYKEKHLSSDEMIRLVKKTAVNGDRDHANEHLKECPLCSEAYEGLKALPDMSALQVLNAKWKLKSGIKPSGKKLEINLPAFYTLLTLIGLISIAIIYFFFFNPDKNKTPEKGNSSAKINPAPQVKAAEHFMVIQDEIRSNISAIDSNSNITPTPIKGVYDEIKKTGEPLEKLQPITASKEIPNTTLPLIKGNSSEQLLNIEDFKIIDYSKAYTQNENMLRSFSDGLSARYETDKSLKKDESEEKINTSIVSYEEIIAKALRNYKRGKFTEAVSDFNFILKYFPNDLNAQFYKALCFKDDGQYQKAIDVLKPLASNYSHTFYQEAKWHLALCYQLEADKTNSEILFKEIISEGGFYKSQALSEIQK